MRTEISYMKLQTLALQLTLAFVMVPVTWCAAEDTVLISAEHVYTIGGDVLSPGQVLVRDGKVQSVAKQIDVDSGVEELKVHSLMPGIVNAFSRAGIRGGGAELSREVTPDFNTASTIDWSARDFAEELDQGVTTVHILPETQSVFSGFSLVAKTAGKEESMLLSPEQSVVIAVSSDPTSRNRSRSRPDSIYVRQPTNRMGVIWIIRSTLHRTQQGEVSDALDSTTTGVLKGMLDGSREVVSVSRKDYDIRSALELGENFGFQPAIYGGDEVYRMMDEFKDSGAPLVYTALTVNGSARSLRGAEGSELRWNVPGKLQSAGVTFCLAGENVLDQARFAVRFGLSKSEALSAITLRPAQILKLENQVGSIAAGKQADLVALSGDPLQPTSTISWTMVGGKIYGNIESNK